MNRPLGSLQIAENVLTEEVHHIDQDVGGSDTELMLSVRSMGG